MTSLWRNLVGRAAAILERARYTEPAALRARYAQLLTVATVLGVTVPGWLDQRAAAAIAVFGIVAPWLQGRRTRADVWSQQTVDDLAKLVALFPGQAAEIKRLIGAGLRYSVVLEHAQARQDAGDLTPSEPGSHRVTA